MTKSHADTRTTCTETAYGLGRHIWLLENSERYGQAFFSSIIVFNVGTCILKISVLFQYRRIFRVPLMQTATFIGLIFEGAWALTLSVLLPLVCTPVAFFWDTSLQGTCLNQLASEHPVLITALLSDISWLTSDLAVWYVMAAINLITDFVIFSLPLPVIKSLQLPHRQKYLLMGVFCLGFWYVLWIESLCSHYAPTLQMGTLPPCWRTLLTTVPVILSTCIISVYRITTLRAAAGADDSTWENVDAAVSITLPRFFKLFQGIFACLVSEQPGFSHCFLH